MHLELPNHLAEGYRSNSQIARRVTEGWVREHLYCPSCDHSRLDELPPSHPVSDFVCHKCDAGYQLKASAKRIGRTVSDGAWSTMMDAVKANRPPHLLLMHYSVGNRVENLVALPASCLTPRVIQRRRPLAATARRAGWVGCNILVGDMPNDARVSVVRDAGVLPRERVVKRFQKLLSLRTKRLDSRTWLFDVWKCVGELGREEFSLADVYAFESTLAALHPDNRHIRPKIRQQLQVLRDLGFVQFVGRGQYRMLSESAGGAHALPAKGRSPRL